jgi:hypothetical protein
VIFWATFWLSKFLNFCLIKRFKTWFVVGISGFRAFFVDILAFLA